jgi:hypothetical protein
MNGDEETLWEILLELRAIREMIRDRLTRDLEDEIAAIKKRDRESSDETSTLSGSGRC